VTYPGIFSGGSTNSVEDRENEDLGGGSPIVRGSTQFENECCYGCFFHGTGNSAQFCQNFRISGRGGFNTPNPPLVTPLGVHNRHCGQYFVPGCDIVCFGRCLVALERSCLQQFGYL
jgi:hypothetical protein